MRSLFSLSTTIFAGFTFAQITQGSPIPSQKPNHASSVTGLSENSPDIERPYTSSGPAPPAGISNSFPSQLSPSSQNLLPGPEEPESVLQKRVFGIGKKKGEEAASSSAAPVSASDLDEEASYTLTALQWVQDGAVADGGITDRLVRTTSEKGRAQLRADAAAHIAEAERRIQEAEGTLNNMGGHYLRGSVSGQLNAARNAKKTVEGIDWEA